VVWLKQLIKANSASTYKADSLASVLIRVKHMCVNRVQNLVYLNLILKTAPTLVEIDSNILQLLRRWERLIRLNENFRNDRTEVGEWDRKTQEKWKGGNEVNLGTVEGYY
jgi:hypothetical protein